MTHSNLIALATAAGLALAGTTALAQSNSTNNGSGEMDIPAVVKSLESEGYTHIESVERDVGRFEVDATAPNGNRVELEIDGNSGEILHSERDD